MATYNIGPGQTYETFAALVAAVTLAENDIVDGGGNTFREAWESVGVDGITFQNATILGTTILTGEWSASGDEWSTALVADPVTVVISSGDNGAWVKLWKGTAGSLSDYQWDYTGGSLYIKTPTSPASLQVELGSVATVVHVQTSTSPTLKNVYAYGGTLDCIRFQGCVSPVCIDCEASFSGADGLHGFVSNSGVLISGLRARYNGLEWSGSSGAGDGVSFHASATGTITNSFFEGNAKGGIANVENGFLDITRSKFLNNFSAIRCNQNTGTTINILNNEIVQEWFDGSVDAINVSADCNILHNTIVGTGDQGTLTRAVRQGGGYITYRNNIAINCYRGVWPLVSAAGDQEGDHNCWSEITGDNYQTNASGCTGTGDVSADPDFWSSPDCLIPMNDDLLEAASDGSDIGAYFVDAKGMARPVVARPVALKAVRAWPVRGGLYA